jgi:ATP-binding cassette subfamily F protein 3
VEIGYYDQEHQTLHMEQTIFDEISDAYPMLNHTKIRNVLASFLFTDDDVFKRIGDLSGGERGRVSLAKLMLSNANFLILDEPTNHLDITSKEILESALNRYTGTVLYVSHDRYFINQTATRILELTGETLVPYIGNYDYYLEKRNELTAIFAGNAANDDDAHPSDTSSAQKTDWQTQKANQAALRKTERALQKTEEQIADLEEQIKAIDDAIGLPENATNSAKLGELTKERAALEQELTGAYESWEQLSTELESLPR